ncbi:MAG: hypothetical protein Q8Q20_02565 [bacterium]|nr:hypothetical protein [bacterium]
MTPVYSTVLRQAWQTVWRNKALWFYGLFLVWIGQEAELIIRNYSNHADGTLSLDSWRELFRSGFGGAFSDLFGGIQTTGGLIITLLILFAMVVLVVWLAVVSVGGIVHATNEIAKRKPVKFDVSFAVGQHYFWRNFVIYAAAKVVDYFFLILTGLLASIIVTGYFGMTVGVILLVLSLGVTLILAFIAKYAAIYVVARDKPLGVAVHDAFKLFSNNWLASIEMAIILFLISFVVAAALLISLIFIAVPFLLLAIILNTAEYSGFASVFIYSLLAIGIMAVVVIGSILTAFQFSAWTLFFNELDSGKKVSKIVGWAERLSGRQVSPQKK